MDHFQRPDALLAFGSAFPTSMMPGEFFSGPRCAAALLLAVGGARAAGDADHIVPNVSALGSLAAIALPDKLVGLEDADSLSLDPHKWLYQPLDCGCLLYRDATAAHTAFAHTGDYAKSLLDATVIRAPVTGTILERAAEKGELVTSGFASTAEGGPQGLVVSLAEGEDFIIKRG